MGQFGFLPLLKLEWVKFIDRRFIVVVVELVESWAAGCRKALLRGQRRLTIHIDFVPGN
jgi:hypothetical protein